MKVLILNGSPRLNGNSKIAIDEVTSIFKELDVDYGVVDIATKEVRGCIACNSCYKTGKCVFNDIVNELAPKFDEADGLIVASPVYFAGPNATLLATLTRLFYSTHFDKSFKVGASIVYCRRGGASATFDVLNKFFTISNMPIVSR